jgi:hypothetical protein
VYFSGYVLIYLQFVLSKNHISLYSSRTCINLNEILIGKIKQQPEHDGSDVHVELNVDHEHGSDIIANMTKAPRVKYITFYEDSESIPGKRTAVWELDKTNHRNIVRSPVLMRELWLQMWHDIQPGAKSKFVTKAKRGPLRDADCYWDYGKACCAWQEYCEYRYHSPLPIQCFLILFLSMILKSVFY